MIWSEPSHYFRANSPVRNLARTVPEESSREELVLERTVLEQVNWGCIKGIHYLFTFVIMLRVLLSTTEQPSSLLHQSSEPEYIL